MRYVRANTQLDEEKHESQMDGVIVEMELSVSDIQLTREVQPLMPVISGAQMEAAASGSFLDL